MLAFYYNKLHAPRISCYFVSYAPNTAMHPIMEGEAMSTAKEEVKALLDQLPDDCSLEDVQYHLYVIEKIHKGIARADKEGALSQGEVERKLDKWTSK
jgi:hypothetical protein